MDVHIFETGNGIIVSGPMRIIQSRGQTRVYIGEESLTDIIVRHELGASEGVTNTRLVRVTLEVLE